MKKIPTLFSLLFIFQIAFGQWNAIGWNPYLIRDTTGDSTFQLSAPSRYDLQRGIASWVPASTSGASGIDDVLAEGQALTAYRVVDGGGQSFRFITSHGGIDFDPGIVSIGNVDAEYNAAKLTVDGVSSIMFFDGVDPVNFGINTISPIAALDIVGSVVFETSHTPSSSSDTGIPGQIAWDASYIYVCIATDTWVRSALTTW